MPKGMNAIRQILEHLENLMGLIFEDENSSLNDKLELAMDAVEKADGLYVEFETEIG
jgi:hypothetical protein